MTIESDFVVIGGGIIGLSIARELRKSFHGSKVVLIEKEDNCGEHASGRKSQYKKWGPPGIRAQLLDLRGKQLEMDFILENDDQSMHILNAVSPAFTCAFPFAEYVSQKIEPLIG